MNQDQIQKLIEMIFNSALKGKPWCEDQASLLREAELLEYSEEDHFTSYLPFINKNSTSTYGIKII